MTFARPAVIALLVVVMAITPLALMFRPAYFDVVFPGYGFQETLHVTLEDRTGLADGMSSGLDQRMVDPVQNLAGNPNVLLALVSDDSCTTSTWLTLDAAGTGYHLEAQMAKGSCAIGTGSHQSVAIHLRLPVDAAGVLYESNPRVTR